MLELSPVILGTMWPDTGSCELGELRRRVDAALDAGVTSIDTAPLYDFGLVEERLGEILAGRRDRVQILDKAGLRWDDSHGEVHFATEDRVVRRDSRPDSLRLEVERSLQRLRCDHIDLLQIHFPDLHTPIGETMGALQELRAEGKIREIGVSNYMPEHVIPAQRALGDTQLFSNQVQFNLLERDLEDELIPTHQSLGLRTLCYSPLARGSLTRPLRDPAPDPGGSRFAAATARACQQSLAPLAERHACSPAAICLAWLLAQPGVDGVVVGARSEAQAAVLGEVRGVQLSEAEAAGLAAAFAGLGPHLDLPLPQRLKAQVLGRLRRLARRRRGAGARAQRSSAGAG